MTIDVYPARFGAPAAAWLAALVSALKGDDPFTPITVLVPDNLSGVMARRTLGATQGLVNVSFVTPATLATRLCDDAVAPLGRDVLAAVMRDLLAHETLGPFAAVAAHPATEAAVVDASLELAAAEPDTLEAFARSASRVTRGLVELHGRARRRLRHLADEYDLARRALARLESGSSALDGVGALVVYLVDDLAPAHLALLRALAERVDVRVIVGVSGVADADAPLGWWSEVLECELPVPDPFAVRANAVYSATDSDDEVREVIRALCARAEHGVALSRMAVLYPTTEPYARLVYEHLAAAGIAHNGPSVQTLTATIAGRVALAVVEATDLALGRRFVLDVLALVPRPDAHATSWEGLRIGVANLPGSPSEPRTTIAKRRASCTPSSKRWPTIWAARAPVRIGHRWRRGWRPPSTGSWAMSPIGPRTNARRTSRFAR
jgi:ATP-dependent helicase/nuclease subunit B